MRTIMPLIQGWQITACTPDAKAAIPPQPKNWKEIAIPHVANSENPTEEKPWLYRCVVTLDNPKCPMFLEFGAVGGLCRVWMNGSYLGEHMGGYSRFRLAVKDAARCGENEILVLADNTRTGDWIPIGGDFNNYSGIYRPVFLITTQETHFDLLYYGTAGLTVDARPDGTVGLDARIVEPREDVRVEYALYDGEAAVPCGVVERPASAPAVNLCVDAPHLWNGRKDPHLYRCRARLLLGDMCLDEVELPFGFRSMKITADKGFFLNGEHLTICGVAKHQDRAGCACAINEVQQEEDIALIEEIGANAVRLSHYQHPEKTYDLCDQAGLVVWAEIPLLALPDGNEALFENAKQQLTELIRQNAHHPAICLWGIENEIAIHGESLEMYRKVEDLHQLAKSLDPTRPTTLANLYCVKNNSQLNQITDMVGYNIYYGWYYGKLSDYGSFLDAYHRDNPTMPVGVSEYGADCSVTLHRDAPSVGDYSEEYQCVYHEAAYPAFRAREFVWGSFVWNMFDFASGIREIGDMKGLNCKGLVTYDRKVKKDAFYYYKAWWSDAPFVHVAGRRYARRCGETTTIKVYSNQPNVKLIVNGIAFARQAGDKVFVFENVPLEDGENIIAACTDTVRDEIALTRVAEPERSYIYDNPNPGFNVENWFTLEDGEKELFPEDRFSIMDEMGVLQVAPEAWALLEKEVPQITGDPRSGKMPRMSLLRIINRISGQFEEKFVKELNRKLNEISKPKKEEAQ